MSLAPRVHNFSISLNGFGTGVGQTRDAPFGHAGERLHQWMFATQWWHEVVCQPGGSGGIDDAFSQQFAPGIGAEINDERVEPAPLKPMPLTETALAAQMGQRAEQAQDQGTRWPSRFATVCRQSALTAPWVRGRR
jgi:hypothetical protein